MSEAKKEDVFGFGGTIQEAQKKLENFGKEQSAFFIDLMEKNAKFQKEQFDLWSKIIQGQVVHNDEVIKNFVKMTSSGIKKS